VKTTLTVKSLTGGFVNAELGVLVFEQDVGCMISDFEISNFCFLKTESVITTELRSGLLGARKRLRLTRLSGE
jgi:hypothetical protein